jgi:hypothetical protein
MGSLVETALLGLGFPWRQLDARVTPVRDRKKLNSGVRVRGVIKLTELGKFKLAVFQKNKS